MSLYERNLDTFTTTSDVSEVCHFLSCSNMTNLQNKSRNELLLWRETTIFAPSCGSVRVVLPRGLEESKLRSEGGCSNMNSETEKSLLLLPPFPCFKTKSCFVTFKIKRQTSTYQHRGNAQKTSGFIFYLCLWLWLQLLINQLTVSL
uniref:Uncharacterized protein n=1 Tax=Seriola lalandi dorsalis TaxID=1841481 RepID=A0A3B4YCJ7_SERLL